MLPGGESSSRTRATYSAEHLHRLDLIGILRSELGMPVEKIAEVLREAGRGGEAMLAMGLRNARESRRRRREGVGDGASRWPPRRPATAWNRRASKDAPRAPALPDQVPSELERARRLVRGLAKSLGWKLKPGVFVVADVEEAVAAILRAMPGADLETSLSDYALSMKNIADREIPESFNPEGEPWGALKCAVLGTYLFEPLILALRRLAHAERAADLARRRKRETASGGRK